MAAGTGGGSPWEEPKPALRRPSEQPAFLASLAVMLAALALFLGVSAGVGNGGASPSRGDPRGPSLLVFVGDLADETVDWSDPRYYALDPTPTPAEDRVPRWPCDFDDIQARFRCGYRERAESAPWLLGLEEHVVERVIPCESRWRLDPGNPRYLGLGQFLPSTWAAAARSPDADPFDPFEQGWAVANNIVIADETWQWPVCWKG